MEAFSFGSYYPGDSAIHRLDPRTKLLLGFVFLITTLTVSGFRGLAPVAIFVVLTYAVSRVPVRRVLSSMAPLLAIVVVVAVLNLFTDQSGRILWQLGFLQISEGSLRSAAFMACRSPRPRSTSPRALSVCSHRLRAWGSLRMSSA